MQKTGKKIRALRDKKFIILTLVLSEKKFLSEVNTPSRSPEDYIIQLYIENKTL
jgi:hypothetical protein